MKRVIVTGALLLSTVAVGAKPTDWTQNRVLPLEKLSVGPWDNFDADVMEDGPTMFFTRDLNQVPNIYRQSLPSTETELFIGKDGDAKQIRLSPDRKNVAYTFYGKDALGDICISAMDGSNQRCITPDQEMAHTPFWINNQQLGYLTRDSAGRQSSLYVYQLGAKKSRLVSSGDINAPVAEPSGQGVIYVSSRNERSEFYRMDLGTGNKVKLPAMDLPGKTGYASFSVDGKFYYFNHYLNDSNGDQRIDGNDHSVVFRASYDDWRNAKADYFPEQLIAVDNNCTFPRLTREHLYISCAFEGSLDVYRLPSSGSIPASWNVEKLWEAHTSTRSYEQRLLLLNRIKFQTGDKGLDITERLLTNYLQLNDYTASRFYIARLLSSGRVDKGLAQFYRVLDRLLEISSLKQRVPRGEITARYEIRVRDIKKQVLADRLSAKFSELIEVYAAYELEQYSKVGQLVRKIDVAKLSLPLEKHIVLEMAARVFEKDDREYLLSIYRSVLFDQKLDKQARLYYAYHYLGLLGETGKNDEDVIAVLKKLSQDGLDARIETFIESERLVRRIAIEKDAGEKTKRYKELAKLLKSRQKDVRLRHAMHSRAIKVLGENDEYKFLELLSRHWLQITNVKEIEFSNVAEQYSVITMDKAYGFKLDKELDKAYSIFYSAIRQTNDLEAHYQFITLGLTPSLNKRENLDKSYAILTKQKLTGQAEHYVAAMRAVYEMELAEKYDEKVVQDAIAKLKLMNSIGSGAAMRDLLLAYLYHIQLRKAQKGYEYDKRLYQKAHYHYMMAMDLGKSNGRILPVTLNNIAWLQMDVRQYGMAEGFFRKRLELPFESLEYEQAARWNLAKSLYFTNQHDAAVAQIDAIAAKLPAGDAMLLSLNERRAFYLMNGGKYDEAVKAYKKLDRDALDNGNRIRVQNAYAYSLMKAGKKDASVAEYRRLLEMLDSRVTRGSSNVFLLPFDSRRLELLAHGFLAKMESDAVLKHKHLTSRIKLLDGLKDKVDAFAYDEASRLVLLAKDYQRLALLAEAQKNAVQMFKWLDSMLGTIQLLADENGDHLAPSVFQGVMNGLTLAIEHKGGISKGVSEKLSKLTTVMFSEYKAISLPAMSDKVYEFRLALMHKAFQQVQGKLDKNKMKTSLDEMLKSELLIAARDDQDSFHSESLDIYRHFVR